MKKSTNEQTRPALRPFGLELLETVPETDLKDVNGGIAGGGFHTDHVSAIFPDGVGLGRPDNG